MTLLLKNTSATRLRATNMTRLIQRLRGGSMSLSDFRSFLKFSRSGALKYVREISDAGVIVINHYEPSRFTPLGIPIYKLVDDDAKVREFLDSLVQLAPIPRTKKKPAALSEPGRLVHRIVDDGPLEKLQKRVVTPQHDELLAHFFGLVGVGKVVA